MPNSANNLKPGTSLGSIIVFARQRLKDAAIENPDLDIRLLICHVLKMERVQLINQMDRMLDDTEVKRLHTLIESRAQHTPLARLIGEREFWGLTFGLNEATLEPRPDSETLIEAALKLTPKRYTPAHILDLGTGTGCLLLSLLHELPQATGIGIDLVPRAVEQALMNATALGLTERSGFIVGNWFQGLQHKFDIIISNPPYIRHADIATLMPEVREHDPMRALDGGDDGLTPYRHIIPQLKSYLNPSGLVVFEVGHDQAAQVRHMLELAGFNNVAVHKDLGGVERCVTACL